MKIFIFMATRYGCKSLSGLYTIIVNIKKLMNPDGGLSTHNRPEKTKSVEVKRQGSFVLKCLYTRINFRFSSDHDIGASTLHFNSKDYWFRSMRLRLLSRCARRESFIRAFSFFSLCFFKLSTSFFPFSIFSFEYINLNNLKT